MKLIKTINIVSAISLITFSFQGHSAPVSPEEKPIAHRFSSEVQANFDLFADGDDNRLVWYVPKNGSVSMLGNPANPVPRFNATGFREFSGVFAGQSVALLGGAFSTAGFAPQRRQLEQEARSKRLRIAPAQAKKATTKFIVSGIETDGNLEVDCKFKTLIVTDPFTGQSTEISQPNCSVTYDDGIERPVDTMQRFTALVPAGQTSVSTSIPFQAKTTPEYALVAQNNLAVGANFDDSISAVVDWEIPTSSITRTARFTIDYNQVFEQASTFAAIHNWRCIELEVSAFFKRLVREGSIKVEYLNSRNQWVLNAPNNSDFVGAVNKLEEQLRNEIFAEMRTYAQPNLPTVSREANSFFTLRANVERQIFRSKETRIFNYNPGPSIRTARTDMFVGCLTGGFGAPVVASQSPNCKELFGLNP